MTTDADQETLARIASLPDVVPPVVIAPHVKPPVRLDLGCGLNPKAGFDGVDLYGDKATHKVDLFKFPWPFEDDSVDEIHTSHFLEHIPAREVEIRDYRFNPAHDHNATEAERFVGQDMLFAFMDECWRIMKLGSVMEIIVPSGRSDRAFQDPTHRRFFMQATFLYFNEGWRKQNGLSHYRVRCNFEPFALSHSMTDEEALRSVPAQQARFPHMWNVTGDWLARLKKLPKE